MSATGLVRWFMVNRKCDLKKASWLAEQVILKRRLKAEAAPRLSKAQTLLALEVDDPREEPMHDGEADPGLPF